MRIIKLISLIIFIILVANILQLIDLPLSYLFGSMIGTLIFIRVIDNDIWFPKILSNSGVFIMGIQIGTSLTLPAIIKMTEDWYNIVIITLFTIGLALLLSIPFRKFTNTTVETAVLASVPGALSQMIIMAEENKNANLLLVSLTQTSRIIFIVTLVPIITHFFPEDNIGHLPDVLNITEIKNPYIILVPVMGYILYVLLRKIKFPAALLLGPIFVTIAWNLTTEITFTLDQFLIAFAQILFGIRIGLQITTLMKELSFKDILAIVIQNVGLILGTFVIVSVYIIFTSHEFTNLFLSAAPGGLAQIIVIAMESGGDIAMISSYHIFRIFFIILVVVPIVAKFLTDRGFKKS